jgi:preprotein translocase subunit SecA
MFNLIVADNSDEGYGFIETKECYKNHVNIIYGDAANYQFDILRHEYSALGTRGTRNFDTTIAIIDEVDSMLIDDNSKIAMLADTMPGMSNLNIFFTTIWQELDRIDISFQE